MNRLHVKLMMLLCLLAALLLAGERVAQASGVLSRSTAATMPTAPQASDYGPDVVMLDELVQKYDPVPFAHRLHAEMAEMWNGCETCHHHTPATDGKKSEVPACKSCHAVELSKAELGMPALKGAYHRQCLNCHRDWMGENGCVACHDTREHAATSRPNGHALSPDDITGRMHKPLVPDAVIHLKARYTPVDGKNVLFRHDEHVKEFGIRCVACHRRDSCGDCHSGTPTAESAATRQIARRPRPMKPSNNWRQAHQPCIFCHEQDKCNHCHYKDDEQPPAAFAHASTGQVLDETHAKLACGQCHSNYKTQPPANCADANCHARPVTFPADRPGPYTPPMVASSIEPAAQAAQPTTRPTIIRIRRGVQ